VLAHLVVNGEGVIVIKHANWSSK